MTVDTENITNIAFYKFVTLTEPEQVRIELQTLCHRLKLMGTVLLAREGYNGMLAGRHDDIEKFLEKFLARQDFADTLIKKSYSQKIPFGHLSIKVKKEILTLRLDGVKPEERTAPHMKPRELHALLEARADVALIDVRNHFEVEYGTFENAVDPHTKSFGEFPDFVKNLNLSKEQKIVTFCTGGIRCEKAAILLLDAGYKNVYQLEGGILEYFAQTPGDFFKGSCFVFDNREALDTKLKPAKLAESKLPKKMKV